MTGTVTRRGVPGGVTVTRVYTGATDIYSAQPRRAPSYGNGYWKQTYNLDAWRLGTTTAGSPSQTYILLVPPAAAPGTTFDAQLHVLFNGGRDGWWQNMLSCTTA